MPQIPIPELKNPPPFVPGHLVPGFGLAFALALAFALVAWGPGEDFVVTVLSACKYETIQGGVC